MTAESIEYSQRKNVFTKPYTFRLNDGGLTIVGEDRADDVIPLSRVKEVQLRYAPVRSQPNRYCCNVILDGHEEVTMTNMYFAGVLDVQDHSDRYLPFLRVLLGRIEKESPQARFVGGLGPIGYYVSSAFFILLLVMVAAILFVLPLGQMSWTSIVKILLLLLLIPSLIRHLRVNKPRTFSPSALPEELIPQLKTKSS